MAGDESEDKHKNRPDDSDFKQQRLKAWQPILTPPWVIITFACVGVLFMIIGILVLVASNNVVEYTSSEYQSLGTNCPAAVNSTSSSCMVETSLTVDKDMDAPVYMYYQLSNFYQNHRRYVKSRSDVQLRGDEITTTTGCDPLATRACDNAAGLAGQCSIYPCGLIAWSVFNDTFYAASDAGNTSCVSVYRSGTGTTCIPWTSSGIAWSSDKEKKFIQLSQTEAATKVPSSKTGTTACSSGDNIAMPYDNYKYALCSDGSAIESCPANKKYADVGNEEFIVWMRTSGLPEFRKLHRIINTDLKAGDVITFHINNIFPVTAFDGKKKIVLSTTTWIGGKNQFLGWAYIVVATLCILLAIGFGIKQMINPRNPGKSGEMEQELQN
jgi:hypothetical protein